MQKILHVSDNPEHFSSIGSALAQIPANNTTPVIIEIAPGIYHEKLTINKPYITLRGMGESSAHTVISYDDYALDLMEDGSKRSTFRTYTLFIDTHDVTLQHLTIENASGDSATHGQAIALYADGDRLMIDSCRLLGHQDTLFTGPLPEKERQPGGFIGPKQFAPRINGRQYYKNCYICGDIDFIFGSATAYFEHCTLESLLRTKTSAQSDLVSTTSTLHDSGCDTSALCHSNSDMVQKNYTLPPIQGYVTAASTPEGQEYGYKDKKNDDLFFEGQMSEERNVAYPTGNGLELLVLFVFFRKFVSVCFQNLLCTGNFAFKQFDADAAHIDWVLDPARIFVSQVTVDPFRFQEGFDYLCCFRFIETGYFDYFIFHINVCCIM